MSAERPEWMEDWDGSALDVHQTEKTEVYLRALEAEREQQAARIVIFEQMLEIGFAGAGHEVPGPNVLMVSFDAESESWVGQWFGILSAGRSREEAIVATVSAVVMHRNAQVRQQSKRIAELEASRTALIAKCYSEHEQTIKELVQALEGVMRVFDQLTYPQREAGKVAAAAIAKAKASEGSSNADSALPSTDTERLDWLQTHFPTLFGGYYTKDAEPLRETIDRRISAEDQRSAGPELPPEQSVENEQASDGFDGWICGNNYRRRGRIMPSVGKESGEPWYVSDDGTKWSSFDVTFKPDSPFETPDESAKTGASE